MVIRFKEFYSRLEELVLVIQHLCQLGKEHLTHKQCVNSNHKLKYIFFDFSIDIKKSLKHT